MHRSMRRRIARLEERCPAPPRHECRHNAPDEVWLLLYEEMDRAGDCASISEFPAALKRYRDAVARAQVRSGRRLNPLPNYLPNRPEGERTRRWRMEHDIPEVRFAWQRLHDLTEPLGFKRSPPARVQPDALLRKLGPVLEERRRDMFACVPT